MSENLFFNYENIEKEEIKKRKSLLISPKILFEDFVDISLKKFNKDEITEIKNFFFILQNLNFDKIYKNYLSHPIRLAQMWCLAGKKVSPQEIKFVLAHNIIENGFLDEIKDKLEINQIKKIKVLTIDRNKETNLEYLNTYYNNIEKYSESLLIFKSLDKLDNLLIGEKYLFSEYSINLLRLQICARLKKYDLRLYDYINSAVNFYEKKYS